MTEVWCPDCDEDVEVEGPWGPVSCPNCGKSGGWDITLVEGGVDEIIHVTWDN